MKFLQESLLAKEKLIYWTRPHWIIFSGAVIFYIAAFVIWQYAGKYFTSNILIYGYTLHEACIIGAFAIAIYFSIASFIRYKTSEYGVTDKRVLMKTGWIQRNSLELFLEKVEAIHIDQSILGRILDYGVLIVVGTGGTHDRFYAVPKPMLFRKLVQEQFDNEVHQNKAID